MLVSKLAAFIFVLLPGSAGIPLVAEGQDSVWTIRGGTYTGETVVIDRRKATRRGSHFWRISTIRNDARIVGWNPSRLPAPVGLRARVSEADSVAFWEILRQMETDMGMRLFEPFTLGRDTDPYDVIVVDLQNMAGEDGVTLITWSGSGAPYDARVNLRSLATLRHPGIVTHEMMHALGFGHTSAWSSVMNPHGTSNRLTRDDVAYAQAAFEARAESERVDMWERLALEVERELGASRASDGYPDCPGSSNSFNEGSTMRIRGLTSLLAITAIGACTDKNGKGPDTIAVPAAAVGSAPNRRD